MKHIFLIFLLLIPFSASAQITWPQGQLLPSFPAPAKTMDYINMYGSSDADFFLFSSLQGLINRTQPRIFTFDGDAFAEPPFIWLQSLKIGYTQMDRWTVLAKYKSEISGLIVYDPAQIHTVNLADRLAKDYNALVASPDLLSKLQAAPYNFPILLDLRGKYASDNSGLLAVYQDVFDHYWENTDKRMLIFLCPNHVKGSLREYAVALGAAVVYLDPRNTNQSNLLNKFLTSMPPGANTLGWLDDDAGGEENCINRVSDYGMTHIASDYCTNLTFHSGMPRLIDPRPMPPKPVLENKIYVAFIYSDGDNLQYVEHLMRKLWNNSDRGKVPIGWTISPSMVDAMPGAMNYYHQSATDNDNLICGPSGYGYTYPNRWTTGTLREPLGDFVSRMEEYNVAAGLRVVTVWNTIHGVLNRTPAYFYANNAPTLLGITTQGGDGTLSIYESKLPGKRITEDYCNNATDVRNAITKGTSGWNGNEPRFLIIQCNPWNDMKPSDFLSVANGLDSKYVVVRPDHIFQLIREANGLPINPGAVAGDGEGLLGTYYNGQNFDTKIAERIDSMLNFDWGSGSPIAGVATDTFTVRWKGKIQTPFSGHYSFYVTCNGARLRVNNELIINNLQGGLNPATYTGKIYSLQAGEKYDITLEYLKKTGVAQCKLEWASAFLPREVVPQSQLYNDNITGINVENGFSNLKVFAANGVLNVEISNYNDEEIALNIYDLYGKVILQRVTRKANTQIDISSFPKGIYIVSLRANNYVKTIKYMNT